MNLAADLEIALRILRRSRGFAAAGILTLGLGIAAATTIFSVVYGVLLRPLPYRDPSALVVIQGEKQFSTGPRIMNFSAPEVEEFAAATRAFAAIASSSSNSYTMRTAAGVEPVSVAIVSARFFATLDTPPLIGNTIDGSRAPAVVISERLWRRHFGGAADAIGKPLTLTDREYISRTFTVAGVMPHAFQYPASRTDVWRSLDEARGGGDTPLLNRNAGGHFFVARRRPGVTHAAAEADAARANDVLAPHYATSRVGMRSKVITLEEYVTGHIGPSLWLLLGAVIIVLVVACANVANLILARQVSRSKEIAVRLALGSSRARLLGFVMIESIVIGAAGGAAGIAAAALAIRVLRSLEVTWLPRLESIIIDWPVMVFAAVVSMTAAIAAGLLPAVLAARSDGHIAARTARGASRLARRLRSGLVVAQIAASLVLLVGATLLTRSLVNLINTDLGVATTNVVAARLDLALGRSVSAARQAEVAEELRTRVATIPSVRAAGFGAGMPPDGEFLRYSFVLASDAQGSPTSHMVTGVPAGPGFFETLQIPLISGQTFDAATGADVRTAILSREAARRLFGANDPIGRTLPLGSDRVTVIGVVGDVKYTGLANEAGAVLYLPFDQSPVRVVILLARADGDSAMVSAQMRQVIATYDPDISISGVQPLRGWVADAAAEPRFRAGLLAAIACLTLLIASVGLYGVIAYTTAQRTTEMSVRVAVGARPADIATLVIWEGARLALAGIAAGLAAAYFVTSSLAAFVFGLAPNDPLSFATASAALLAVAVLASWIPARHAARVDPVLALRAD